MKDFEALKDIWHEQKKEPTATIDQVLKMVRKDRNSLSNKILLEAAAIVIAMIALVYIWITIDFKLWTTHLAMVIFITNCLYYLTNQLNSFKRISRQDAFLEKPEEYINYIKQYKKDRYIENTRKYTIYTICMGVGFMFYFIEIFYLSNIWFTIGGMIFTVLWILFSYFVIKRNYIRKEEAKLNSMIESLEKVQEQFREEEL